MKPHHTFALWIAIAALSMLIAQPCRAVNWRNPINRAINKAVQEAEKAVTPDKPASEPAQPAATPEPGTPASPAAPGAPAQSGIGKIIFSSAPIDPANPPASQQQFKAGDHIYALIVLNRPWRAVIEKSTDTRLEIPIDFTIGPKKLFQYITVKKPDIIKGTTFVLDIAPDVEKMTAYRDPEITYPMSAGRAFGPMLFTDMLRALPAGTHPISFSVAYFGDTFATGACTISGDDYSAYAALNTSIKEMLDGTRGMPAAGMVNRELEAEMKRLCENAGWTDIEKLVIVDKDWWINYHGASGSPVKSRHIAAAVAAKDSDGSYYYCTVTFEQPRLITGAYGALELTRTGPKNKITKENIGK